MKKLLCFFALILTLVLVMASCGEEESPEIQIQNTVPTEHTHSFGEWEVVTEGDCLFGEFSYRSCQCGKTEHSFAAEPAHSYQNDICTVCGAVVGLEFYYVDGKLSVSYKGSKDITEIVIPEFIPSRKGNIPVECIETYGFSGLDKLTTVTIPDSVNDIGIYAFSGCKKLENITIPEGVTEIQVGAFKGCTSLKSITIPDSVEAINFYAFKDCTRLKTVYIGSGLLELDNPFEGCNSLETIYYAGTKDDFDAIIGVYCISYVNVYKWNR